MKIYDTLIIGSGYTSIGYAVKNENSIICEEHQICDVNFYLPLRRFAYHHYEPRTEEGKRLQSLFDSYSLFKEGQQNTNGFEFVFCKYITEKNVDISLKCRVIRKEKRPDDIYDVTVQTNEGLSHIFARKILDTQVGEEKKFFTLLFVCDDIAGVKENLLSTFKGAEIERAFYKDRYALHIPTENLNENEIKLDVYNKWNALSINAKILYMAPVFYGRSSDSELSDESYKNPIEAFEAGYLYEKEADK